MKKKYIYTLLLLIIFSLTSCKKNYDFTDNKKSLSYGTHIQDCISYTYYDLNQDSYITNLYYIFPGKFIIGMKDESKKGKFTLSKIIYNPEDGTISAVQDLKTYILKPGKNVLMSLETGYSYYKGEEYKSYQLAILLYENYDIYYELI